MTISVIIPSLNEGDKISSLINELQEFPEEMEIIIVEVGDSDYANPPNDTNRINTIRVKEANRGNQLIAGEYYSSGEWLLFLHADSILSKGWKKKVSTIIQNQGSKNNIYFFDLKITGGRISYRILEFFVFLRSNFFQVPYGDQGLLIHKEIYNKIGGFKPFHIMEDLDFILRAKKESSIKSIGVPIFTDSRKWQHSNIIKQSLKNMYLRYQWRKGIPTAILHRKYYSDQ